ncbi:MAG TPA: hypothetical protein VKX24_00655, partial [Acidimicrobiia bacterium]|nr:hypothetical protein [Acidimicrobiia bacterium]
MRRFLFVGGLAGTLLLGCGVASAAPSGGSLDPSFGNGGIVTTPEGQSPSAAFADGVTSVSGGETVAVGVATGTNGTGVFTLARYRSDGSLDPSFGNGGIVTTDFGLGGDDLAAAVATEPNGNLVVVGQAADSGDTDYSWAVAEYRANGSLDQSF